MGVDVCQGLMKSVMNWTVDMIEKRAESSCTKLKLNARRLLSKFDQRFKKVRLAACHAIAHSDVR